MLSVRLSVTLVDQNHIGWKSWKLHTKYKCRLLRLHYLSPDLGDKFVASRSTEMCTKPEHQLHYNTVSGCVCIVCFAVDKSKGITSNVNEFAILLICTR